MKQAIFLMGAVYLAIFSGSAEACSFSGIIKYSDYGMTDLVTFQGGAPTRIFFDRPGQPDESTSMQYLRTRPDGAKVYEFYYKNNRSIVRNQPIYHYGYLYIFPNCETSRAYRTFLEVVDDNRDMATTFGDAYTLDVLAILPSTPTAPPPVLQAPAAHAPLVCKVVDETGPSFMGFSGAPMYVVYKGSQATGRFSATWNTALARRNMLTEANALCDRLAAEQRCVCVR